MAQGRGSKARPALDNSPRVSAAFLCAMAQCRDVATLLAAAATYSSRPYATGPGGGLSPKGAFGGSAVNEGTLGLAK